MTDVLINTEQVLNVHGQGQDTVDQLPIHLLIVVGQTFCLQEKKLVLDRINSSKQETSELF